MTDFEKKYDEARSVIQEWVDKQGHEKCWYYPEILRRLVDIYQITPSRDPQLPPLEEFKKGCGRYQREEYNLHQ